MKLGAALPIVNIGLFNPSNVVELHIEKIKTRGEVYFSTNIQLTHKKARQLDFLLLFNREQNFIYKAKIKKYYFFENKGVPDDSTKLSPRPFISDPCKHWFKLSSITSISEKDLESIHLLSDQMTSKYKTLNQYLSKGKRMQMFYIYE